jgi:hypothetical protein
MKFRNSKLFYKIRWTAWKYMDYKLRTKSSFVCDKARKTIITLRPKIEDKLCIMYSLVNLCPSTSRWNFNGLYVNIFYHRLTAPSWAGPPYCRGFKITIHTQQDSSGRVISPMQRHVPDKTQHSQQISMHAEGFEPSIPDSERPQTHALDRAATGIGHDVKFYKQISRQL